MCYDYELDYLVRRAEEARRELKKAEARNKPAPKPAAPAEAPQPSGQEEPVPV